MKNKVFFLILILIFTACREDVVQQAETETEEIAETAVSAISSVPTPPLATATTQFIPPPTQLPPTPTPVAEIPVYGYRIINTYPHDREAFTQGLIIEGDEMIEGTGLWGQSSLRRVDLETGEVLQIFNIDDKYFGEGITVFDDRIIQITWQSHTGFIYDEESFEQEAAFTYETEGWGITHDGERLIMSDGTDVITFRDPYSMEAIGQIQVRDANGPVYQLNELEYVEGEIFANVWQTNSIARISPETGQVVGWIDLSGLLTAEDVKIPVDVLNGIAYDAGNGRLFITGKLWPKLFEIELIPQ